MITSENANISHIHKHTEKSQISAQACMFTLTDKQGTNRNKQKMGLQVENITKEAEYKTVSKQRTRQAS